MPKPTSLPMAYRINKREFPWEKPRDFPACVVPVTDSVVEVAFFCIGQVGVYIIEFMTEHQAL